MSEYDKETDGLEPPKLSSIVLYSNNIPAFLKFYRALGIQFKQEQHGIGPTHYSTDLGGILMEVYPGDRPTRFGFSVNSVNRLVESMNDKNIPSRTPINDSPFGKFATYIDPEGRVIEIRENTDF